MKNWIRPSMFVAACLVIFSAPLAQAEKLVSAMSEEEKPCLKNGEAGRCFELGFHFMGEKSKASKKLARYYFAYGCSLQKGHMCSIEEIKTAAFDVKSSRSIASQKPSIVKSPKSQGASKSP